MCKNMHKGGVSTGCNERTITTTMRTQKTVQKWNDADNCECKTMANYVV